MVPRLGQHLWRDVGQSTAPALQQSLLPLVAEHGGQAEVGQLEHRGVLSQQDVLGFDVAVGDAARVEVLLNAERFR